MSDDLTRAHEKLFYKAKYLKTELEDTRMKYDEYKAHFLKEVSRISDKQENDVARDKDNMKDHLDEMRSNIDSIFNDEEVECSAKKMPKDFKKLYKKIMIKVHPDKLSQIKDEDTKRLYLEICNKATSAAENIDWFQLVDSASQLGISITNVTDDNIQWLENSCTNIVNEISGMKKTYPWIWGSSSDKDKGKIIEAYSKALNV